eukprot:Gregarina_sp_Pseudo_9__1189@NODE_1783_length_1333_cov_97_996909_g1652_i0_p1_GENE_NODE_1783_length_1333_cov_97_996909_g1652_i0NODE_1783_length_1333_cov_97_996909_g1652_i0_p1_ORF_typecomplete_len202_score17_65_NODE_1783_length_1333_cov_97_996909_g1652_i067672
MVNQVKEEQLAGRSSVAGEDPDMLAAEKCINSRAAGDDFDQCGVSTGHEANRFRIWIENGGNARLLIVAAAPLALILLFPVLVALRLVVLLCLPVSCLLPVYLILRGRVLTSVHSTLKAGLIVVYLGVLAFAVVPYLFVWPFYGFLEVLPACIMTVPILLASVPLAVCGCVAGAVVWFLSSSDYYAQHSYRAACLNGTKKI